MYIFAGKIKFRAKTLQIMKGLLKDQKQTNLFAPNLIQIINPNEELVILAGQIDWNYFDKEFSPLYSTTGRPAAPIRVMVSLLLLKHLYNYGDETVIAAWVQNPYYQYFSGMDAFQWKGPCDPSDLVHFRNRIGPDGFEKILKYTAQMHGDVGKEDTQVTDTTVQETNITYPTDTKLQVKIIKSCVRIADETGIVLRQRYPRKLKQLLLESRFGHHPRRRKKAKSARRQIKTIAGRLVRELGRKLDKSDHSVYFEKLKLFERQLRQRKKDTDKIYSFHAPHTYCIAKGKEHKEYEFGTKVSITSGINSGVIMSAYCLEKNDYDGHTLSRTLEQIKRLFGTVPKRLVADRGYRGVNRIGDTEIAIPGAGKKNLSAYEKRKLRRMFRRRAAIEPLIGHLKTDHRMGRSFYKGISGDQINVLLACSAWNLKKYMKKLREAFSLVVFSGLRRITDRLKRDLLALETLICNRYIPSKVWIGDLEMSF